MTPQEYQDLLEKSAKEILKLQNKVKNNLASTPNALKFNISCLEAIEKIIDEVILESTNLGLKQSAIDKWKDSKKINTKSIAVLQRALNKQSN